jgi:hypothetical protein
VAFGIIFWMDFHKLFEKASQKSFGFFTVSTSPTAGPHGLLFK